METVVVSVLIAVSGFLFVFSLGGLATYLLFMPSIKSDSHVFSTVHGSHLLHPLSTALFLGLFGLCRLTGSVWGLVFWVILAAIYVFQTALILERMSKEQPLGLLGALNLIIGGEIVTVASGAKSLPPWRLHDLPPDTWIVDVRTKPEFHWNRLQGAENYPWGANVEEAAETRSKDTPVLVMCFSGHRSPSVAVMLRRLGFKTVYNLNWGILYLILLERGAKRSGPFGLTRAHLEPNRRGKDYRAISVGYITTAVLTLIIAPLQAVYSVMDVPLWQKIAGAMIGLSGLAVGVLSFNALGRNFRVFAAPRRSGTLITSGVYSKVRHPMYTAVIAGLLGYVVYFNSIYAFPFWFACTLLYVIKAIKEEALLLERYPDYAEYKKRTKRFVPFII